MENISKYNSKNASEKLPLVPLEYTYVELNRSKINLPSGFYPTYIDKLGNKLLSETMSRHETFTSCLNACNAHNNWIGLSDTEVINLYSNSCYKKEI